MLSWYKGVQSVPKNPPHHCTTITSLNHWYTERWIYVFMLFMPNSDPTIRMSQQKLRLIRPGSLLQSSIKFWWAGANYSLSFQFLADRRGTWCGLLLLYRPSASRFDVLCIQKCSSAYLGCNYCCLSIISNQSGHSPLILWHQQGIVFPTELPLTVYLCFFVHFL